VVTNLHGFHLFVFLEILLKSSWILQYFLQSFYQFYFQLVIPLM